MLDPGKRAIVRGAPGARVLTCEWEVYVRDDSAQVARRTRDETIEALASFPDELERLVLRGHADAQLRQPASDGGWGVVEILPHLRDWEVIYLERVEKILAEGHPDLPGFDDTLWSIERDYRGQDPRATFEELKATRARLVVLISAVTPEDWERTGQHSYYGDITLSWLLDHICDHDHEHLEQARDALSG